MELITIQFGSLNLLITEFKIYINMHKITSNTEHNFYPKLEITEHYLHISSTFRLGIPALLH